MADAEGRCTVSVFYGTHAMQAQDSDEMEVTVSKGDTAIVLTSIQNGDNGALRRACPPEIHHLPYSRIVYVSGLSHIDAADSFAELISLQGKTIRGFANARRKGANLVFDMGKTPAAKGAYFFIIKKRGGFVGKALLSM